MILLWWLFVPSKLFFTSVLYSTGIVIVALIVLGLLHKEKIYQARLFSAFGFWFVIAGGVLQFGGLQTPLYASLVPLSILAAGYLAGLRVGIIVSILSVAGSILLIVLELYGIRFEPDPSTRNSLYHFIGVVPAFIATPMIIYFSETSLLSLFQRIRRNEIAQLRNVQLETTVREQKRIEVALTKAKEAAESADRAKSQFLANMSHEIRTPMNGVIGMTNLLLDEPLDNRMRDSLEIIKGSGEVLLRIINDILDYSKMEYGAMELDLQPLVLRECIESAVASVSYDAKQKNLPIHLNIESQVPSIIRADSGRINQVLTNLLGNAVKYTERGQIDIDVQLQPNDSTTSAATREPLKIDQEYRNANQVNMDAEAAVDAQTSSGTCLPSFTLHFIVRDTGIGIPSGKLDQLFKPFSQVDETTTRRFGGTGLGLMISKRLTELMNGEIWVDSVEDKGSDFHFTIHAEGVHAPHRNIVAARASGNEDNETILSEVYPLRILLAEDNLVNQKIAKRMLQNLGYQVDIVANGEQAVNAVQTQAYDLILMDIHMPMVDGLDATQQIKDTLPPSFRPRIVALTASATTDDREQTISAGMDGFLAKPLRKQELIGILESTVQIGSLIPLEQKPLSDTQHRGTSTAHQPRT